MRLMFCIFLKKICLQFNEFPALPLPAPSPSLPLPLPCPAPAPAPRGGAGGSRGLVIEHFNVQPNARSIWVQHVVAWLRTRCCRHLATLLPNVCATMLQYVVEMLRAFGQALSELSLARAQFFSKLFTCSWCVFLGTKPACCIFPGYQGLDNEV